MTMAEVIDFMSRFASAASAPVRTHTTVTSVTRIESGYEVATDNGSFRCRTLVVASGACNAPTVPALQQAVPSSVQSLTPFEYHNPDRLPAGGVLVVGASATGVQLADEIRRSGRPVVLSVGEHVRLPRTYRGRDVLWWMDASGVWNQRYDEIDDLTRARKLPSPQLVGTPERTTLDLNVLSAAGVNLVGRLATVRDGNALFSGGLRNQFALADAARTSAHLSASSQHAHPRHRGSRWTSRAARCVPSSGRPGFTRTTAGSAFQSSIAKGICATKAASSTRRDSMRSACLCSVAASPRSSMEPRTTRATSSLTWRDICRSRPSPIVRSLPAWQTPRCARRP
jgi:hypothetical protein